jgi:hypothetical protein
MREEYIKCPLLASKRDITMTQDNLGRQLEQWRDLQAQHMSEVKPIVLVQSSALLEDEQLFLPSDFSEQECHELSLMQLAVEEGQLWEGQLYECILQLRWVMKNLSVVHQLRQKNSCGQHQAAHSHTQHEAVELTRDHLLDIYNKGRQALLSLRKDRKQIEDQYPALSLKDLYRKSTVVKRQLGDTHHFEGQLWLLGNQRNSIPAASASLLAPPGNITATSHWTLQDEITEPDREDEEQVVNLGKLWSPVIGLSNAEVEQWERDGKLHTQRWLQLLPYIS